MPDIKMRGPESAAPTLSFAGVEYAANRKGVFTVPVEAYDALLLHGFTAIGDTPGDDA